MSSDCLLILLDAVLFLISWIATEVLTGSSLIGRQSASCLPKFTLSFFHNNHIGIRAHGNLG